MVVVNIGESKNIVLSHLPLVLTEYSSTRSDNIGVVINSSRGSGSSSSSDLVNAVENFNHVGTDTSLSESLSDCLLERESSGDHGDSEEFHFCWVLFFLINIII